jgi:hypothetical protein
LGMLEIYGFLPFFRGMSYKKAPLFEMLLEGWRGTCCKTDLMVWIESVTNGGSKC